MRLHIQACLDSVSSHPNLKTAKLRSPRTRLHIHIPVCNTVPLPPAVFIVDYYICTYLRISLKAGLLPNRCAMVLTHAKSHDYRVWRGVLAVIRAVIHLSLEIETSCAFGLGLPFYLHANLMWPCCLISDSTCNNSPSFLLSFILPAMLFLHSWSIRCSSS